MFIPGSISLILASAEIAAGLLGLAFGRATPFLNQTARIQKQQQEAVTRLS